MNSKSDEFQKRLLSIFKAEAEEHLKAMTSGLIELEKDLSPEIRTELIESVFREAHSLKGAARSASMFDVGSACQSLENVFAAFKRKEVDLSPKIFDTLHKAIDILNEMTFFPDKEGAEDIKRRIAEIKEELTGIITGGSKGGSPEKDSGPQTPSYAGTREQKIRQTPQAMETVRISADRMFALLLQAEEILSVKLATFQHAKDVGNILSMFDVWSREWSKRYRDIQHRQKENMDDKGLQPCSQSLKALEFLDWTYTHMRSIEKEFDELKKQVDRNKYSVGVMVDSLLEDVKKTFMQPFSTLMETFPKLVRDLSHEQGKDVELSISGEDIEIDRRILEEIRVPFTHLVRNSIDHGIEKPGERLKNNKHGTGKINIAFSMVEDNKVEIVFSDDGRGIDVEKVKEASVKLKIISPAGKEDLPEQRAFPLVFESGVSTSPIITDISGRGLGLAIVKEKIEQLGGRVSIESIQNGGTSFRILLPVSISTFRGVLVKVSEQEFVIPTVSVDRALRVRWEEVGTIENTEAITLEEAVVPLVRLSAILELPDKNSESSFLQVLIAGTAEGRIGFVVDEVLNEQEIMNKYFGPELSRVRNIASATILGSGKVVPILNVSDLIRSAVKYSWKSVKADVVKAKDEEKRSILVVEDSITSRMLIKNILETSGFLVETAVDGVDAITRLKTGSFDLVVSDVDMPRMNGFDLTANIRSDKTLSEMPVVLVTALESGADREHGIDVGANAYIVKSDFNQSNLLEVIRRLI